MSKNYGNDSQIAEIVKYISDTMKFPIMGAGGGFAPIGTINSYMGTTAPIGWLACDGTVYNISDYPDLATHIASQFGSTNFFGGDGVTTFAVPDTTDITSTTLENGVYIIKATVSDAEINAFNVYTPREHQVAWWEEEIDGVWKRKPVYEKRVDCGAMPNNTTKEVAHGISNLDFIVSDECHTKNPTNGQELTLPHAWYEAVGGAYILFDATKISLTTKADLTSFTKTEVVLKYTKTTDDWQTS